MTEQQAIDMAQGLLKNTNPSEETLKSLLNLEEFIDEDIFGDLIEALTTIAPPELLEII